MRFEKAILRDSELLSEVNNAFCNSHPLLAQKVVTRSARAAVSKISADALLAKALSVRRSQAGSLLKTIHKVNAKKLQESDILVGHRFHTAGAEPYFFDNSYTKNVCTTYTLMFATIIAWYIYITMADLGKI